jgi:hypothetical protein
METLINTVEQVNFKVETSCFKTYEFSTHNGLYVEEAQSEFSSFRLMIYKNEEAAIFVANEFDYDISEEVSYLFDIEKIKNICENQKDVPDFSDDYYEKNKNSDIF